jgi:ribulose kinase
LRAVHQFSLGNLPYLARGLVEQDLRGIMLSESLFQSLVESSGPFRKFLLRSFADRTLQLIDLIELLGFGQRGSFELMKSAGLADIRQVRVSGGGARSPLWRQILADVLDVELVTVNSTEGAAYSAALLAATGAGAFPNLVLTCAEVIQTTGHTEPDLASTSYGQVYLLQRELYPLLRPTFNAMGGMIARGSIAN